MRRQQSSRRLGRTILASTIACGSLGATVADNDALGSVNLELRDVPVVMIVLDELPIATLMDETGEIDQELFPNFARIRRDSTWFRNTTTPALFTKEAVPAILTGLYPTNTDPDRQSVFSLLSGDYDIPLAHEHHLVEPARGTRPNRTPLRGVCPSSACQKTSSSMTKTVDRYGHLFPGTQGNEFLRFLDHIREDDKPRFYFLHYVMPHQPWIYFPTGQAYNDVTSLPGEVDVPGPAEGWNGEEWLIGQAYQRHLLQTSLLDRQLGALIDRLEAQKIYERSLIVITADHGIAFEPGASKRIVAQETEGHISAVPFFIKEPFQDEGRISDRPLETVDVVPTLIDALSSSDTALDADGISGFSSDLPTRRVRTTDGMLLSHQVATKFNIANMKYEMFARTKGQIDFYELGPGRTRWFVGQHLRNFEVNPAADAVAQVENAKEIETANPRMPLLPALLEGRLDSGEIPGRKIVIAMNDEVAAVTTSYRDPRAPHRPRFYALLPPDSFGPSPNDLDLYLLEAVATKTLTPLAQEDPSPQTD